MSRILKVSIILLFIVSCPFVHGQKRKKNNKQISEQKDDGEDFKQEQKFRERFFQGITEASKGNYPKALKAFEACLDISPSSTAVYFELYKVYNNQRDKIKSINHLEAARRLSPEDEDLYVIHCNELIELGEYSQLISITQSFIGKNNNDDQQLKYRKLLAKYYEYNLDYPTAAAVYDDLEKDYGYSDKYSSARIRLYKKAGEYDKALIELDKLIGKRPNAIEHLTAKANVLMRMNRSEEAASVYKLYLSKEDAFTKYRIDYIKVLLSINENNTNVSPLSQDVMFDPSIEISDKLALYTFITQKRVLTSSENDQLLGILEKQHSDEPKVNVFLAESYFGKNDLAKSVEHYEKAKKLDSDNFSYSHRLIELYYELDLYEKMADECDFLLGYFPSLAQVYLMSGIAHTHLGNENNALIMLETAKSYAQDNPSILLEISFNLAELFYVMDEKDQANKIYETMLEEEPNNARIYNNYAYLLAKTKSDLKKATELSQKALELEINEASYLDTYGYILFLKKEYSDARTYLEKALEINPNDADILAHYGDVLYFLEMQAEAVVQWQKAADSGNQDPQLLQKIKEKKYVE